jgi:hypothetical protein
MAKIVGILLRKICAVSVSSRGFRSKLDDAEVALAGGALLSAKGRGGGDTDSGYCPRRAVGWIWSPGPFIQFFLFLSLFFSVFLCENFKEHQKI